MRRVGGVKIGRLLIVQPPNRGGQGCVGQCACEPSGLIDREHHPEVLRLQANADGVVPQRGDGYPPVVERVKPVDGLYRGLAGSAHDFNIPASASLAAAVTFGLPLTIPCANVSLVLAACMSCMLAPWASTWSILPWANM